MIERAKFQCFKSLRDVEITFDSRLTVLVGPNGCGKTSVLQGMHFVTQLTRPKCDDLEYHPANLTNYVQLGCEPLQLNMSIDGNTLHGLKYATRIDDINTNTRNGELFIYHNHVTATYPFVFRNQGNISTIRFLRDQPEDAIGRNLDHTSLVRYSANRLAMPLLIKADQYPPRITKDGTGLAATLSYLQQKHRQAFADIENAFKKVIPLVTGINFDSSPTNEGYLAPSILLDYVHVRGVPASQVSSGTLIALGILTTALHPEGSNVILLDDLDNGLHPKAQLELIRVFRALIDQKPDLQIIATSHSLYILHELQPNEVRVMALREDGSSVCKPLTDHPDYERWKEAMSPGEFWSHVGEDWLLTPKPEPVAP